MSGPETVCAFHDTYRQFVPGERPFNNGPLEKDYDHRMGWYRQLVTQHVTIEDWKLVLSFLDYQVKREGWNVACLGLKRLCDPSNFFEKLSLAGIWKRGVSRQHPTPSKRVLGQFRGHAETVEEKNLARSIKDILGNAKKAKEWAEWTRKAIDGE